MFSIRHIALAKAAIVFTAATAFATAPIDDEPASGTPRLIFNDHLKCVNKGIEALMYNHDYAKLPDSMRGEGASIEIKSSQRRTMTFKITFQERPDEFALESDFVFSCDTGKFIHFVPYR